MNIQEQNFDTIPPNQILSTTSDKCTFKVLEPLPSDKMELHTIQHTQQVVPLQKKKKNQKNHSFGFGFFSVQMSVFRCCAPPFPLSINSLDYLFNK